MPYHLSIDYDEGVAKSYRGVVLTKSGGKEVRRWNSGDPQKDWEDYLDHARSKGLLVFETSSITHFVFDNIEWRFVIGDDGHEHLVPEDRPEWVEEMALA